MKPSARISAEEFIRVWQTSESLNECCSRLPTMPRSTIRQRRSYYRKKGIPLKRLVGEKMGLPAMIKLAQELATEAERDFHGPHGREA